MHLIPRFAAQRAAFERAFDGGDWSAVGAHFHEDITYEVLNMQFHCIITGREAVIDGLRRSVERFDKLCTRTVGIDSRVREEGPNVLVHSGIRFERPGAPPTEARLWEIATYRDGLIVRLMDIYDPGACEQFESWMAAWGEGLDARYL
jgi:ketosteroid isomerase-like protein